MIVRKSLSPPFLFALLTLGHAAFTPAVFAAWGNPGVASSRPTLQCEFLLTKPRDAAKTKRWVTDTLAKVRSPAVALSGYSPKPAAFAALGVPETEGMMLKLEASGWAQDPYWLILIVNGKVAARFPFHLPPVYLWKQVPTVDTLEDVELYLDLEREDLKKISAGSLVGDVLEGSGRKFISIRRLFPNYITVSLGIDVPLNDHGLYTDALAHQILATGDGEEENIYSRIEVLTAHFPEEEKPAVGLARGKWN